MLDHERDEERRRSRRGGRFFGSQATHSVLLVENDEQDAQGPPTYEGKALRHLKRRWGQACRFMLERILERT